MRLVLRRIYILARAAHRWLFVDVSGEDYFKKDWKPSSSVYNDLYDDHGEIYESERGTNHAGIYMPIWIIIGTLLSPVWVPMLLWDSLEPKRKRLNGWLEGKRNRLTTWLGVDE